MAKTLPGDLRMATGLGQPGRVRVPKVVQSTSGTKILRLSCYGAFQMEEVAIAR